MNPRSQSSSTPYISKSTFLQGRQCPKLLWSVYNAKHLFPQVDAATQAIFDQGHTVGELAKRMFPGGIEIVADPTDFEGAIQLTQEALPLRRPIFEATFSANGGYARADILNPVWQDEWDIIEVKSTTRPKAVHIPDLAFQKWVFTAAGIKIRRCVVCHVNREFVRHGEIDPWRLFTRHDVTAEVAAIFDSIGEQVRQMAAIVGFAECPQIGIGKQCGSPFICPLHDNCWAFLPPRNVMELYQDVKGRGFDLLDHGILRLADIPADYALSRRQEIQRAVAISGEPHVKRTQIERFLSTLEYPLHFLDFETFTTAIPIFDGTWPYQQIPFQFSLHLVREVGAQPEHRKFLAEGRIDPRPEFVRRLQLAVEPSGSIVVFNAAFEKGRLREIAEVLPEYECLVEAVTGRMVDLLVPFRGFHFYHSGQCGRASMKSVLPALTGKDYRGLEIQEGSVAGREFLRVSSGDVSDSERTRVRRALDSYCGLDTEGMAWILEALRAA
jgi:hypothetical protein